MKFRSQNALFAEIAWYMRSGSNDFDVFKTFVGGLQECDFKHDRTTEIPVHNDRELLFHEAKRKRQATQLGHFQSPVYRRMLLPSRLVAYCQQTHNIDVN